MDVTEASVMACQHCTVCATLELSDWMPLEGMWY